MIKTVKNKALYEQELSIEDIIHNFSPVATRFSGNIIDGFIVTIKDNNSNFCQDIKITSKGGIINTNWENYVFDTKNIEEVATKQIMDNADVITKSSSVAIDYLSSNNAIDNFAPSEVLDSDAIVGEDSINMNEDSEKEKRWFIVYLSEDGKSKDYLNSWFTTPLEAKRYIDFNEGQFEDENGKVWKLTSDEEITTEIELMKKSKHLLK